MNGEFPELGAAEVFPDYDFLSRFEPEISDTREVCHISVQALLEHNANTNIAAMAVRLI